jgi:hypothetical protein
MRLSSVFDHVVLDLALSTQYQSRHSHVYLLVYRDVQTFTTHMYQQIDIRLGRPDLVHEVLQTIELNSGIPLTSAAATNDTTNMISQVQRSHSSFFTMNLGGTGTSGSKVAHDATADDINNDDEGCDDSTAVNSYGPQTLSIASSSTVTADAFQVGNEPVGSVSAASNSRYATLFLSNVEHRLSVRFAQ